MLRATAVWLGPWSGGAHGWLSAGATATTSSNSNAASETGSQAGEEQRLRATCAGNNGQDGISRDACAKDDDESAFNTVMSGSNYRHALCTNKFISCRTDSRNVRGHYAPEVQQEAPNFFTNGKMHFRYAKMKKMVLKCECERECHKFGQMVCACRFHRLSRCN